MSASHANAPDALPAGRLRRVDGTRLLDRGADGAVLTLADGSSVQLNPVAAALLAACDGTRDTARIFSQAATTGDPAAQDAREFLSAALAMGWVEAAHGP